MNNGWSTFDVGRSYSAAVNFLGGYWMGQHHAEQWYKLEREHEERMRSYR